MRAGLSNYFETPQDPNNPDSVPAYDQWGPDFAGYWSIDDWITWFSANVAEYGQAAAIQTFATAWNMQGTGAAPRLSLNSTESARVFFRNNGLGGLIPVNAIGMATDGVQVGQDAITAAANAAAALAKASSSLSWLVPIAGIAFLYFAVQTLGKDPGGQAKKFAGAARELY